MQRLQSAGLTVFFFAKQVAVLVAVLGAAWGGGALVLGSRESPALRTALGFVIWGETLFALAVLRWLRAEVVIVLFVVAVAGGALRCRVGWNPSWTVVFVAIGSPIFLLAVHPPLAFDETLYHLPFVRAYAAWGGLRFLPELRFPVFPVMHELLCVPVFLFAGDTATHLVSLAQVMVTALVVAEWTRDHAPEAAPVAAALYIGSPIVIHYATVLHVDSALVLFTVAGFCALDRRKPLLSGLFFGAACSVKYLGGFFALAALIIALAKQRRAAPRFALAAAAAALPMTLWITWNTGNPLFPFASRLFGRSEWTLEPHPPRADRLLDALRVVWDVTFARERVNEQPPMTPLLIALVVLVAIAAPRAWRARALLLLSAAYVAVFAFLPQDSRYLMSLLPLFCVAGAVILSGRISTSTAVAAAMLPAIGYVAYRLMIVGVPSADPDLSAKIAGYAALAHAGDARVFACGGEQLQYYVRGRLRGDPAFATPFRREEADYYLVLKRRCPTPASGGMTLVYEDAHARLWRIESHR